MRSGRWWWRPRADARAILSVPGCLVLLACWMVAPSGVATAQTPSPRGASSSLASGQRDTTWANQVASYAERLLAAGYAFRGAEWAIALAGGGRETDYRGAELLARLPSNTLRDDELLYLGYEATRWGPPAAAALVALARYARNEGRAVAPRLLAGARALGADSAAVVAVGAGWPPAERLGFFTIGVLAPVNGELARQGEAMVRGAELAIEEHNRRARFPLTITVGDSGNDPLVAGRAAAEMIEEGVGALIGDLRVETTIPAAAAAAVKGVPLISPGSGRTDLGTIGNTIYQTIVPRELQAEALARAAVRELALLRLAILAPDTRLGIVLADRFEAEARHLGAEIVARLIYPSGQTNFQAELEQLAPLAPEAIFLAGSEPELMATIPQLAYYEVGARVLAPEDLGSLNVLRETQEFLDWAVFAEGHYGVPPLDGETFARRFENRFKSDADANAARGYVAARTLASVIEGGAYSRDSIREALAPRTLPGTGILVLDEAVARVQLFHVSATSGVVPLGSVVDQEP